MGARKQQFITQSKQHYKMYKSKKAWIYAAITTFGFVTALGTTDIHAQADEGDTSTPSTAQTSAGNTNSSTTDPTGSVASSVNTDESATAPTATPATQSEGPVYTDKDAYQAELDQYNANAQTTSTSTGNYAQQMADYQAKLAQYQQDEQTWQATVKSINEINAAKNSQYQTELDAYNKAMEKYNAELQAVKDATDAKLATATDNAEKLAVYAAAIGEYTTAKKDYDRKLAAYNAAVSANQEATTTNQTLKNEYDAALIDYNNKLAAYNAEMSAWNAAKENANQTIADNQAKEAAYQLKYDDYVQALHVYTASKAKYDQDKATYDTNEPLYQTAIDKQANAQAVVTQVNDNSDAEATASQTLNDLLQAPAPTNATWLAGVQSAINALNGIATTANDLFLRVNNTVTAYQTALDNLTSPKQPSALSTGETATELAAYETAVQTLASSLANAQTKLSKNELINTRSSNVNTASDVLRSETDTINQKLAAINTAIENHDIDAMKVALDAAVVEKQTYLHALSDYNSAVQNYLAIVPTATITELTAPDESEWTALQQKINSQVEQNNAYQTAKTTYDALQPAFTAMQSAVSTFSQAITAYNDLINSQKATLDQDPTHSIDAFITKQEAAATAVTEAQNALKATLTPDLDDQLQAYITAATAYQQTDTANVVDLNALETIKTQLGALKTVANQDLTATISDNKLALSNPSLKYIYAQLQAQVDKVNAAANNQAKAANAWNKKVAEAQADGRWTLFFNGDHGLLALANQLTEAKAAYADALNNTTTTFKAITITEPATGKTFEFTVADTTTENAGPSLSALVDQYQTAITQYNATHSQALPDAGAVLSGVDVAELAANFSDDSTQLMSKIEGLLTQVSKLAADVKQNKIVTDRFDSTSDTFTGTSDGSLENNTTLNMQPTQLTATIVTMKDATDFTTLASHSFVNATDAGNYTTTLALNTLDYGQNVTGPNGIVKTTLYDQQEELNQLLNLTYTDVGTLLAIRGTGQPAPASATMQGLPIEFSLNGVEYYFAAYSYITEGNVLGNAANTSEIYTFTSDNPVAEFEHNPLLIAANKVNNTRIYFYFMPVPASPLLTFDVTAKVVANLKLQPVQPDGELVTLDDVAVPEDMLEPTAFTPNEVKLPDYVAGEKVTPEFAVMAPDIGQLPKLALNDPNEPNQPGESPEEPDNPTPPTLDQVPNVPEEPNKPDKPDVPPYVEVPKEPNKPTPPEEPTKPELDKSPNIPELPTKPTPPAMTPDKPLPPEPVTPVQPTPPDLVKPNKPTAPVPPTLTLLPPIPYGEVPGSPVPPDKPRYVEPDRPGSDTPGDSIVPNTPGKRGTSTTGESTSTIQLIETGRDTYKAIAADQHSQRAGKGKLPQTSEDNADKSSLIGLGLLVSLLAAVGLKKRREE